MLRVAESRRLGEGRYRVVVAANERSRNPLWDLNLAGVDFTNYRRNPVVLYNHDDAQVPVGRTLEIGQDSTGSIAATFEFLPQDPFAERVKNAWDMGFLRAASIRWLPLETERGQGGRIVTTRADMLEWSIVAIPADPTPCASPLAPSACPTTCSTPGGARWTLGTGRPTPLPIRRLQRGPAGRCRRKPRKRWHPWAGRSRTWNRPWDGAPASRPPPRPKRSRRR